MKSLLLFSAASANILRDLFFHAQLFVDCALCDYRCAMDYTPEAIALSALLQVGREWERGWERGQE
jgi:hypothetical protein